MITRSFPAEQGQLFDSMCHPLGVGLLLVGCVWGLQAIGFTATDASTEAANAVWFIMGAVIAGIGAGFLLVAHSPVLRPVPVKSAAETRPGMMQSGWMARR